MSQRFKLFSFVRDFRILYVKDVAIIQKNIRPFFKTEIVYGHKSVNAANVYLLLVEK